MKNSLGSIMPLAKNLANWDFPQLLLLGSNDPCLDMLNTEKKGEVCLKKGGKTCR